MLSTKPFILSALFAACFSASIQANDTLIDTDELHANISEQLALSMEILKQQLTQDMDTILVAEEQSDAPQTQDNMAL